MGVGERKSAFAETNSMDNGSIPAKPFDTFGHVVPKCFAFPAFYGNRRIARPVPKLDFGSGVSAYQLPARRASNSHREGSDAERRPTNRIPASN